jgi:hypothetical protein
MPHQPEVYAIALDVLVSWTDAQSPVSMNQLFIRAMPIVSSSDPSVRVVSYIHLRSQAICFRLPDHERVHAFY